MGLSSDVKFKLVKTVPEKVSMTSRATFLGRAEFLDLARRALMVCCMNKERGV
jgi:hypothetical protein